MGGGDGRCPIKVLRRIVGQVDDDLGGRVLRRHRDCIGDCWGGNGVAVGASGDIVRGHQGA